MDQHNRQILHLGFDIAIPGDSPVSDRAGLLKFREDFEAMRNRIAGIVHTGSSKDKASKTLPGEFHWTPGGLAVQQVDSLIAELK